MTAREECGAAFEAFDSGRQSYRALFGEGLWEAGLRSPLYGGSHSAFRRRWDAILESLLVPTELGITRADCGEADASAFHGGMEISKLLWRMRLKHQGTLESYLQECVASTVLPLLPESSRRRIAAASAVANFLLQT